MKIKLNKNKFIAKGVLNMNNKKKTLINYLGLLGVIGFISYTAAVIFAPSAYPGYD